MSGWKNGLISTLGFGARGLGRGAAARLAALSVALVATAALPGCKRPSAEPAHAAASAVAAPAAAAPAADTPQARAELGRTASALYAALPRERPGHGTTDYPGHAEGHVPKSYAMVLLAELARLGSTWRSEEPNLARTAGQWLLDHADANGNGVIGWGLPVAWDAYEDGSVNPPDTEYTITTAIVIDALLTWAERDAQAPRERIGTLVAAAIEPYLDGRHASPTGMAPYSLAAADQRYDTFNPAAYLAGQLQRASLGVHEPALRARYLAAADTTMRVLLAHRLLAPGSGHWYWNYSVQQALPNDLPHAGYIIDGVRTYIEHGGRLADQFDWYAVLAHLDDFKAAPQGHLLAFPAFRKGLEVWPARSYDLGVALHLACSETRTEPLVSALLAAAGHFRTPQARYTKYPQGAPVGGKAVAPLVVNEYEAYLYRGLSTCALRAQVAGVGAGNGTAPGGVTALQATEATGRLARSLSARAAREGDAIALLAPSDGMAAFRAAVDAPFTRADGRRLEPPSPGVPVQVLTQGDVAYLFHRHHPENHLALMRFDGTRLMCHLRVEIGTDATAVAALRVATVHGAPGRQRLHAVVYHNPSQANWLLSWDIEPACPVPLGEPQRLPSLEEPAGSTYEMIPSLHFIADGAAGTLWLAGGNVQMQVAFGGELRAASRVAGCRHVVESALTPSGPAHLCIASAAQAVPRPSDQPAFLVRRPIVVAPAGVAAPAIDARRGVPWRLAWSLGALQIDHAANPRQLRALLRRDLARSTPGGWMEYGINNEEGRIPWSQIYYLNGLLDMLDLAARDARALELYGPLLAEVRARLDMEVALIDAHVAEGRHRTRAFTVDRSRALFGVQTGRFLLLLHRYRNEVPNPLPTPSLAPLKRAVQRLEGHIEVLATAGEEPRWIRPGLAHLRWPRGSAFTFDGMPVPYNHQNEWAYAVLATADAATPKATVLAATEVLQHFVDRIAPAGTLPAAGAWDYWWGRAYDGWAEADGYSVNMPRYGGDRIKAWISFRTIDAMALVSGSGGAQRLGPDVAANSRASAQGLAARGLLYPFANHAWVADAGRIHLHPAVAQEYARVSSPWELGGAAWSLAVLAHQGKPPLPGAETAPANR